MSNQARWSVLQSYNLLKWHKHAHRAAVKALESGGSLSVVIRRIEEAMTSRRWQESPTNMLTFSLILIQGNIHISSRFGLDCWSCKLDMSKIASHVAFAGKNLVIRVLRPDSIFTCMFLSRVLRLRVEPDWFTVDSWCQHFGH